jgi:5'-methylthioadenosine phosphorylase
VDTFFGDGIVAHISLADPTCAELSQTWAAACKKVGVVGKLGGTYICMEGPQFSTRAESKIYRQWGADVIGMTNLQEARLAREAEICYSTLAMVTDYDCWHEGHDAVTVDQVIAVAMKNADNATKVVREAIVSLPKTRGCKCGAALQHAIMTDPKVIPAATREKLSLILDKYLPKKAGG